MIAVIIAVIISIQITGVIINPGIEFVVGNKTYSVQAIKDFSSITIDSDYIIFNSTGFYVTSSNIIGITIIYISNDFVDANNGDKVVEFDADTSSGSVLFDLSGFVVGNYYIVQRDGVEIANVSADGSGIISFSNSLWSSRNFDIFQSAGGSSVDSVLPEVSNLNEVISNPIDTDVGFGWENITCSVTDDVMVDEVFINITRFGSSFVNTSMTRVGSTDEYYYNSTFLNHGNYSYFVWVNDSSDNSNISNSRSISISPNWDINNDGRCTVLDLNLVSNHFYETGVAGWIREDVDNNGMIQVLDLVFLSNHYNEIWWM